MAISTFRIQDKKFHTSLNLSSQFSIASTLGDYSIGIEKKFAGFKLINNIWLQNTNNVLIIDGNVYKLYKNQIKIKKTKIFLATADEQFKTLRGVVNVLNFLQKNKFSKQETVIVVGGGVVQDVAATVSCLYKRGVPWIYFPTTLLAMADSCIGAKSSINFAGAKNQLGVFRAPSKIIIDPGFLYSLPQKEIRSGLGEIYKLCLIGGQQALKKYVKIVNKGLVGNLEDFSGLILQALAIKKAVIEEDEFDKNYRKALNFGHTFGHALESLSGYKIAHGQAVIAGIITVNEISCRLGLLSREDNKQIKKIGLELLDESDRKVLNKISLNNLTALLKNDKKNLGGYLTLVLLKIPGSTLFWKIKMDTSFINFSKKAFKNI